MRSRKSLLLLILVSVLVGAFGMLFPLLGSTFSPYYGSIAKHIAISNNWTDLIFSGHDWLDKPHFPFWITALSFKIFGINSFAYILPGFIFNLIGGLYTYKLSRVWYDEDVSLLATLFYLTTLHLMLSALDIRAEAYLLGEIIPACYYFLLYDRQKSIYYLCLGAFFSGLALMTKGLFVFVTICSGLVGLWIYQKRMLNCLSYRWWLCILLSIVFALPELVALYAQFDLQPDKIVFGLQNVSGIRWFFWDSQFGRFFNTGPIASTNPPPFHWLFFVHTFLWAFLPWWPMFFGGVWALVKDLRKSFKLQDGSIYFLSSFFITFILFSATSFQVDHYTNIIFPFACIISAEWLIKQIKQNRSIRFITAIEIIFGCLFLAIASVVNYLLFSGVVFVVIGIILVSIMGWLMIKFRQQKNSEKVIIYPIVGLLSLFVLFQCVNGIGYAKYDAGYNIALLLNQINNIEVIAYKMDDVPQKGLDFYSKNSYISVDNLDEIQNHGKLIYLVSKYENVQQIMDKYPTAMVYKNISGCEIGTYLENLFKLNKLKPKLTNFIIIKLN